MSDYITDSSVNSNQSKKNSEYTISVDRKIVKKPSKRERERERERARSISMSTVNLSAYDQEYHVYDTTSALLISFGVGLIWVSSIVLKHSTGEGGTYTAMLTRGNNKGYPINYWMMMLLIMLSGGVMLGFGCNRVQDEVPHWGSDAQHTTATFSAAFWWALVNFGIAWTLSRENSEHNFRKPQFWACGLTSIAALICLTLVGGGAKNDTSTALFLASWCAWSLYLMLYPFIWWGKSKWDQATAYLSTTDIMSLSANALLVACLISAPVYDTDL